MGLHRGGREVSGDREGLLILGAGWYALEIAEYAEDAGWRVGALIELLDPSRVGTLHGGHSIRALADAERGAPAIVAGGGDRRRHWAEAAGSGLRPVSIVHPTAHVSASAHVSLGAIVGPMVVVGAETTVGEHVILSRGALVGHHVMLGPFTRVLPGANVAGHVRVGDEATIGMSAGVADHVQVGERATVAAGSMVLRDVGADVRVQGVPAREYRP